MFSKLLLLSLLLLLVFKLGLLNRLRRLKPRLDRAVNLLIAGLAALYLGHLLWWLFRGGSAG